MTNYEDATMSWLTQWLKELWKIQTAILDVRERIHHDCAKAINEINLKRQMAEGELRGLYCITNRLEEQLKRMATANNEPLPKKPPNDITNHQPENTVAAPTQPNGDTNEPF